MAAAVRQVLGTFSANKCVGLGEVLEASLAFEGGHARVDELLRSLEGELGAAVDELHLDRLLGRIGARPVQVGTAILALGMLSYLAARFAGEDVINPAQLEVAAQDLRNTDPSEASKRYVELAALARRAEDRIGYLVEAALMADFGKLWQNWQNFGKN